MTIVPKNSEELIQILEDYIDIVFISVYRQISGMSISGLRINFNHDDLICSVRIEYKINDVYSLYVLIYENAQAHMFHLSNDQFNHILYLIENKLNLTVYEFSDGIIDYMDNTPSKISVTFIYDQMMMNLSSVVPLKYIDILI